MSSKKAKERAKKQGKTEAKILQATDYSNLKLEYKYIVYIVLTIKKKLKT